jgi:hypothetical protein
MQQESGTLLLDWGASVNSGKNAKDAAVFQLSRLNADR